MSVKEAAEEAGRLISQEELFGVIGCLRDRRVPGAPGGPPQDAAAEVGKASSGCSANATGLTLRSVPPPPPAVPGLVETLRPQPVLGPDLGVWESGSTVGPELSPGCPSSEAPSRQLPHQPKRGPALAKMSVLSSSLLA